MEQFEHGHKIPPAGGQLNIRNVYVKDLSFESPQSPDTLGRECNPHLDIQLKSASQKLDGENTYEVTLHMTITASYKEKTIFTVDLTQAGTFELTGVDQAEADASLQVHCPTILFPFARETIANLITKGGFPQLLIGPINFEAIYNQKIQALQAQQQEHGKPH